MGYALGRTIQLADEPLIDSIVSAGGNSGMSVLVSRIVTSKQFLNRTGGDDAPAAAPLKRAAVQTTNSKNPNQAGGQ